MSHLYTIILYIVYLGALAVYWFAACRRRQDAACLATAILASATQSVLYKTTAKMAPHKYHPAAIPTQTPPRP